MWLAPRLAPGLAGPQREEVGRESKGIRKRGALRCQNVRGITRGIPNLSAVTEQRTRTVLRKHHRCDPASLVLESERPVGGAVGRRGLGSSGVCPVEGGSTTRLSFTNAARLCPAIPILGFCLGHMTSAVMGPAPPGGGRWVNGVSASFWRMKDEAAL